MKNLFLLSVVVFGIILLLVSCQKGDLSPAGSSSSLSTYDLADGSSSGAAPGSSSGNGSVNSSPAPQAGVITAGEWNDLGSWSFWQGLLQKDDWSKFGTDWHLTPAERYSCLITSADGQPAIDVHLSVRNARQEVVWEGTTNMVGRVQITPQLFDRTASGPFVVSAGMGQQTVKLGSLSNQAQETTFNLPSSVAPPKSVVDVQVVVDATGSMGDEMEYLKNELNDVVEQAQRQLPNTQFRMGSVFYRDKGDEYLTRPFPFTSDLTSLIRFISEQRASGGGDFPEAVDEGLEAGLNQQWSSSARVRILFLVLDAPPHNAPETIERMAKLVRQAGQKGIRIIPITASGIDKSTEFLMRAMAIGTQGTYVFITDHSGIGNKHLEPTIGDYKVEYLNDLMTRLIVKYSNP